MFRIVEMDLWDQDVIGLIAKQLKNTWESPSASLGVSPERSMTSRSSPLHAGAVAREQKSGRLALADKRGSV